MAGFIVKVTDNHTVQSVHLPMRAYTMHSEKVSVWLLTRDVFMSHVAGKP